MVKGSKRRLKRALAVLGTHHSFNVLELPTSVQRCLEMTWYCHTCQINNGPRNDHCKSCYAHWTEVWQMPKRRSRSKSRKGQPKLPTEEKTEEKNSLLVFPEKVPWVASTPTTRISSKGLEQSSSAGKGAEPPAQLAKPSQSSTEETVMLTEEEAKILQSLRSLQASNMQLTSEMAQQMESLVEKECLAASSKALTHGHLNKLHRLRNQVSASAKKIVDVDREWTAFTKAIFEKVKEHAQMYQRCRADLLEAHNQKRIELFAIKEEMSAASRSLLGQNQPDLEVPKAPDIEDAMEAFQDAIAEAGMVNPIDLTEEDDDDVMEVQDLTDSKKTVKTPKPFRGTVPPTKVANVHLKVKQEMKESKESKKEEK